jgi:acyl-coenzyme A thioesterase PaaI-like protein
LVEPLPSFISEPDPDHPGWMSWELRDQTRYNAFLGRMLVKRDGDKAITRMFPETRHSNLSDAVHGGTLTGFIDISLFAGARLFGLLDPGPAVTLNLSFQFIGAGRINQPLDCEMELLKETGRLLFLRGLAKQGDAIIASFEGTIRKPPKARQ